MLLVDTALLVNAASPAVASSLGSEIAVPLDEAAGVAADGFFGLDGLGVAVVCWADVLAGILADVLSIPV